MRKEQTVWCSSPQDFLNFKNEAPEKRANWTTLTEVGLAMENCGWIQVGTAVIIYSFDPIEDGMGQAVAACDLAESKLREELNEKLACIREIRQKLLSLPAPKESQDD